MYILPSEIIKIINDYNINIIEFHKRQFNQILSIIKLKKQNIKTLITFICIKCKIRHTCYIWKHDRYGPRCDRCRIWYKSTRSFLHNFKLISVDSV